MSNEESGGGDVDPRPVRRLAAWFSSKSRSSNVFWILLALVILVAALAVVTPPGTFVSAFNAQTLAIDASVVLILAAGMTFVIVGGGLDLSIGSVLTFSAVVSVMVMKSVLSVTANDQLALVAGVLAAIGAGLAWGAFNGLLIAYASLPPFVVTLGSLGAALGGARLLTGGDNVGGGPRQLQDFVGTGKLVGIPVPFVIGVIVVVWLGLVLAKTRFGEHVYMLGSSEEAARRGGIDVRRRKVRLYLLSGGLAGLAGLIDVARFSTATVTTGHTTDLLATIAAVVIGGASLVGGIGVMAGTIVGVFIPVVLNNGLLILGIDRFWQDVVIGMILIGAVSLDEFRRKNEPSR
jgi:ribose transport system permease protein